MVFYKGWFAINTKSVILIILKHHAISMPFNQLGYKNTISTHSIPCKTQFQHAGSLELYSPNFGVAVTSIIATEEDCQFLAPKYWYPDIVPIEPISFLANPQSKQPTPPCICIISAIKIFI